MKTFRAAFLALSLVCFSTLAHAGDGSSTGVPSKGDALKGRLGIGFTNQIATTTSGTVPAIDAKYYVTKSFAASLGLGFNTRKDGSIFAMGLKGYRNIFQESNLLFYLGGGAAYVNNGGNKLQVSVFLGSEFFLAQLPSLGFSFEAGVRGDSSSGSFAIATTGDAFLSAGMHFYF